MAKFSAAIIVLASTHHVLALHTIKAHRATKGTMAQDFKGPWDPVTVATVDMGGIAEKAKAGAQSVKDIQDKIPNKDSWKSVKVGNVGDMVIDKIADKIWEDINEDDKSLAVSDADRSKWFEEWTKSYAEEQRAAQQPVSADRERDVYLENKKNEAEEKRRAWQEQHDREQAENEARRQIYISQKQYETEEKQGQHAIAPLPVEPKPTLHPFLEKLPFMEKLFGNDKLEKLEEVKNSILDKKAEAEQKKAQAEQSWQPVPVTSVDVGNIVEDFQDKKAKVQQTSAEVGNIVAEKSKPWTDSIREKIDEKLDKWLPWDLA